ncbi:TIR domain-containing protein [Nocardia sp. NBC_00565]|uniref:nSTAND1 domain-containing NTPase n=1 Tax=Nocardia sp. NBC_00565 TaxID=2975993 RepID=UPI002E805230|nr:TIR domain-containing protein [Nocardia sp. NBC_00565]WUC03454.1 TIR domain-containing protein [Nocardia sp. NBC_00565]
MSYSSRDRGWAVAVRQWLIEHDPGLEGEIFLDVDPQTGIAPGVRWKAELARAVDRCEAVICLISPHWEKSHECATEFRLAEALNKRIFCARLDPQAGGTIAREWQFCDLYADDGRLDEDGLRRLSRGLREAGISAEYFPWPPPDDPERAPYRGWEPMQESDAAVFFGRDTPILRAMDVLRGIRHSGTENLFVVLGPSGAGKSSFMRAGLIPRLRRDSASFLVSGVMRPERAALTGDHGLAASIHELRTRLGLSLPVLGDIKAACVGAAASTILIWLQEAQNVAAGTDPTSAPTLVLPIDQSEELFAPDAGPEAAILLTLLSALAAPGDSAERLALIVLVTIRADRYESLQTAPEISGLRAREFGDLKPMPATQFKEVITGPAARASAAGHRVRFSADLVEALLADAAGGADTLPLLALTLSRLHLDYGAAGDLSLANYQAMGGIRHVVQGEIDALLSADPATRDIELATLRGAFVPWLATIDPHTDQPLRRVARWAELPSASHALLDAFVARRLLVKDERGGEVVVEVATESLLRQWNSLSEWLREQADDLKEADGIERAALAWEQHLRDDAWLFEGLRLASAQRLAESPELGDRLRRTADFLSASRTREQAEALAEEQRGQVELRTAQAHAETLRKRARTLRAVLVVTVIVAVVAAFGLVRTVLSQREVTARFREATSARLAAEVQSLFSGAANRDDIRSIMQTLAAQRLSATADVGLQLTALSNLSTTYRIIDTGRSVIRAAPSPDGHRALVIQQDARPEQTKTYVELWDIDAARRLYSIDTGPDQLADIAFSPDGRRFVTAGADDKDGHIQSWDTETGRPIDEPLTVFRSAYRIALSANGAHVVAAGFVGADSIDAVEAVFQIWDLASRRPVGEVRSLGNQIVRNITISPDGQMVITGGMTAQSAANRGRIQLWDATGGQPIGDVIETQGPVESVAFSPDSARFVTGTGGLAKSAVFAAILPEGIPAMQQWDAHTRLPIGKPMAGHNGGVETVAYSPHGNVIVSGGTDRTVRLWNSATQDPVGEPLAGHGNIVVSVSFLPNTARFLSAGTDGTLRLWNYVTSASVGHTLLDVPGRLDTSGRQVWPQAFAFGPDAHHAAMGTGEGGVFLLDPATGNGDETIGTGPGDGSIGSVAVSPDGHRVASGGDGGWVRLWDTATRRAVGNPPIGHDDRVNEVRFSPDGRRVLSRSDKSARVWNTETGLPIGQPLTGCPGKIETFAFSPDSRRIAGGCDDATVRLWDTETGSPIGEPMRGHKFSAGTVLYSPDGDRMISVSSDSLRIWDAHTRQLIAERGPGSQSSFGSAAVSPDGRYIVTGGTAGILRRDARTGEAIGELMIGSEIESYHVAFTRDGRYIIANGYQTLRVWDTDSGRAIGGPLRGPIFQIVAIETSPDNQLIATYGIDGYWLWPAPSTWTRELCAKLSSNMSHEEWDKWVSPDIEYIELCPGLPVPNT